MYKTKSYYTQNKDMKTSSNLSISNNYNKLIETFINKDKLNFNKEINNLKFTGNKNKDKPILKLFNIIKNNFDDFNDKDNKLNDNNILSEETNSLQDTDLKLEYLQYLITFDINESNGIFLEDKLEIAKKILKDNNYNLKY
jgi:hypothetical protein